MPSLLPNSLCGFSATPSAPRASTKGPFPKPFTERASHTDEASANHTSGAKAVRLSHCPAIQAIGVQSRLHPVAEVANTGLCADRRTTSMGKSILVSHYDSSGSEHDPSSVCLAAMVNEFLESDSMSTECAALRSSVESTMFTGHADIGNSLESLARCKDELEINLLRDVQAVLESAEHDQYQSGRANTDRKRIVMKSLQSCGYDAAICKTKWDHSDGLSGGDYEFIDVLLASDSPTEPSRLLVDIEFRAQFEIARPLSEFSAILRLVPPIFVGRPERLQQIVHVMAEATKQSLRIKGMHLPPWRKLNYMRAKWFSSYKRTTNSLACRRGSHDSAAVKGVQQHNLDLQHVNEVEDLYRTSKPLQDGSGHDVGSQRSLRGELITVMTTSWQPPPLETRSQSHTRMQSSATGLTSMLLHADLPIHNEVIANAA